MDKYSENIFKNICKPILKQTIQYLSIMKMDLLHFYFIFKINGSLFHAPEKMDNDFKKFVASALQLINYMTEKDHSKRLEDYDIKSLGTMNQMDLIISSF